MNNFKKIGLTALAASLVSVSAHAGEMSVAGGASIGIDQHSGNAGGNVAGWFALLFSLLLTSPLIPIRRESLLVGVYGIYQAFPIHFFLSGS